MNPAMPYHAVRFVLGITGDTAVPVNQAAMLYALLCEANRPGDGPPAFPRDLMLDAPEQGRTRLRTGDRFAFGGGLIGPNAAEAGALAERLRDGLRRLGSSGKSRRQGFGGNFELAEVEDLVAGEAWTGGPLRSLGAEQLNAEIRQLSGLSELTLRFVSPLRIERPGRHKQTGRSFFDGRFFDLPYFLSRLLRRMRNVGVVARDGEAATFDPAAVEVLENRLVWIDMAYGGPHGKVLGGVVGRLRLRIDDPTARAALVWGQYMRVGKNAHFGFGRYRIESLGGDPLACRRAMPLLESAWTHPRGDALAMHAGLDAGGLTSAIEAARAGRYVPLACQRVTIGQGERSRQLHIPPRIDRVLQRLTLEALGPALDQFLESSSFAWRRGLGRHSSARAIARAFRQGFVYAVKADIDRFFDTVDRELLADRLDAYLADDPAVALLLAWVRSGGDAGLPTGAPLSPLLANLFLDHFDERIASRGGRLVRYGDDFLILCRTQAEADALLVAAREEAAELLLRLNDSGSPVQDLREPFTFLGFQFEAGDAWHWRDDQQPRLVEELGWRDASNDRPPRKGIALPGELPAAATADGITGIVGPCATTFETRGNGSVWCHYSGGAEPTRIPLDDFETLVVLGRLGISAEIVRRLCESGVNVVLCDERGLSFGAIVADVDSPPDLLAAQVDASRDPPRALAIARTLIAARLHNTARLAEAIAKQRPNRRLDAGERLVEAARRAESAESLDSLRGIEGWATARWYESFGRTLGSGFTFERRVAPDAEDPVNALLNIAHTLAFRLALLAIKAAGLAPMIGFLHKSTARFPALAADLQEPFRPLMERAVIEATHTLRPRDFRLADSGPYRLALAPAAARTFQAILWRHWAIEYRTCEADSPASYRQRLVRMARGLRRHLLDQQYPFAPPCQPEVRTP